MTSSAFDIFNGDADGITALHQLRLAQPRPEARLITGVKRDIRLLEQMPAVDFVARNLAGAEVTVLDISLHSNRDLLPPLLEAGARVAWFDHHHPGDIPAHAHFSSHIDTDPAVCSALLVDRFLDGACRAWAVVGAFGDNLIASAAAAAEPLGLDAERLQRLRELGECLNYNGYGEALADLHFHPAELYRRLQPYADPFAFMRDSDTFDTLRAAYREDLGRAEALEPLARGGGGGVWRMPDAAWSRRVSGPFANLLARREPEQAHAVAVPVSAGLNISVRAPVQSPTGAGDLCRSFGGGGREGAAGINGLAEEVLPRFVEAFLAAWP